METHSYRILHLKATRAFDRLSDAVRSQSNLDLRCVEDLITLGAVYLNRERTLTNKTVAIGDYIRVHNQPKRFPLPTATQSELTVKDTEDFLIAYKPAGLPTHPTLDNAKENFLRFMGEKLLVTHRLDQFTAGLVCFAKTEKFQRQFNSWLRHGKVEKFYYAHTTMPLPLGHLVHFMNPQPSPRRKVVAESRPGWKKCELFVEDSVQLSTDLYRSRIRLITGRTHQIRAQLAAVGAPLIGDAIYGSLVQSDPMALIAYRLVFPGGDASAGPPL